MSETAKVIRNLERDEKVLSYWPRDKAGNRVGKPRVLRLGSSLDEGKAPQMSPVVAVSKEDWAAMNSDAKFMECLRGLALPKAGPDIHRPPAIRVEDAGAVGGAF